MDPRIWGKNMWTSLIHIAQGFPERPSAEERKYYTIFYTVLGQVLPCHRCQVNFQNHIAGNPPNVTNRDSLLTWLWSIYNLTLKDQDRPDVSFKTFMETHVMDCKEKKGSITNGEFWSQQLVMCAVVVVILWLVYRYLYRTGKLPAFLRL